MFKKLQTTLYAALNLVQFSLLGQMVLSEVYALIYVVIDLKYIDFVNFPMFRKVILSLLSLLFFCIITDVLIVNNTPDNYLRGWAVIVVTMALIIFFFKIFNETTIIVKQELTLAFF